MSEMKYADNIISRARALTPEIRAKVEAQLKQKRSTLESTHLMTVDDEMMKGFFYVDCNWLWSGSAQDTIEESHVHDFGEVIGFIGSNRDDPHDLGGEIVIWLDGREEVLTRSCLIYVPAGTVHCPILFKRIDTPVFYVSIAPEDIYKRKLVDGTAITAGGHGSRNYSIITATNERFNVAASGEGIHEPTPRDPSLKSARILHLEDDIVKGAFYVDFVWIYEGSGAAPAPEHSHEWPEVIAMAGCDPELPRHLGGRMSIVLDGETHIIEKSSLVCIPAGLSHCPWKFLDIKKPTLVFSTGPQGMYTGTHKKD